MLRKKICVVVGGKVDYLYYRTDIAGRAGEMENLLGNHLKNNGKAFI